MHKIFKTCVVLAAAVTAQLALAADTPTQPAGPKKHGDPNEVVCERQEELGSRLGSKRVCATRAEWQERRQQDRMQVDRTQMSVSPDAGH